jgi:cytochrome c
MQTASHAKTMSAGLAAALWLMVVTLPSAVHGTDVARGKMIIELYCARCHATGHSGESTHKSAPPFRFLSQRYPVESLAEAFAEGIVTGHPDMPQFQFLPDEIDSILAYLQSLQGP